MNLAITKVFEFEASHYLPDHMGKCKNLHGHNYRLDISVVSASGDLLEPNGESRGMVADFSKLKACVNEHLIKRMDHAFLCETEKEGKLLATCMKNMLGDKYLPSMAQKYCVIGMTTTAENLCFFIAGVLKPYLLSECGVEILQLRLWETPDSSAMLAL